MQPFSRETITDRRQPHVRWTAVFAGALVALGSWMLLQLLFTGGALSSIDPDEIDNLSGYGIGATVGSVLAPLLAMLAGGLVAGRLASYFDDKISAFHGGLVWAITSVVGLVLLGSVVGSVASHSRMAAHTDVAAPPPGASDFVDAMLDSTNAKLKAQNAPTVDKDDFLDAARYSLLGRETFDRGAFVTRLDDKTSLSRPEADAVVEHLGTDAPNTMIAANQLAAHRESVLEAAEDAGNALFAAGIGLLLCLLSAVGGAILGSRMIARRRGERGDRRDRDDLGDVTYRRTTHTTAQYPAVPPAP